MYDTIGDCQIGVEFDYLESVLTDRGIIEESLGTNQFLKIKNVTYIPERKFVIFDCEVFQHLMN
jgi:hypothetical protein